MADFATPGAMLAGPTGGPVVGSFSLCQGLYSAVTSVLDGWVNTIVGNLTGWIMTWFVLACTCVLLSAVLASALSDAVAARWNADLQRLFMRFGGVMLVISSAGAYQNWVSRPLLGLPNTISSTILTGGTTFTAGGSQFDRLINGLWDAALALNVHTGLFDFSGMALGLAALILAFFGTLFICLMFLCYLITYFLLYVIVAIGPLAVVALIFIPTRHYFAGWLSGVASQIVVLILISVLLSILLTPLQALLTTLATAPANANANGSLAALAGLVGMFFIGGIMSAVIPMIAPGLVGGVMHAWQPYFRAGAMGLAAAGAGALAAARSAGSFGADFGGGAAAQPFRPWQQPAPGFAGRAGGGAP